MKGKSSCTTPSKCRSVAPLHPGVPFTCLNTPSDRGNALLSQLQILNGYYEVLGQIYLKSLAGQIKHAFIFAQSARNIGCVRDPRGSSEDYAKRIPVEKKNIKATSLVRAIKCSAEDFRMFIEMLADLELKIIRRSYV